MAANAVRSWEELLGIMPYEVAIARPPYGPTTDAATRAHAEAALLAAYDRYFALAPEPFDPEPAYVAASMAYRRAALLFRMGRSAEAAAAAERLATHPGAQPDVCAAAARLAGVARLERPDPPDQPSLRARLREISRRCPPPSGT